VIVSAQMYTHNQSAIGATNIQGVQAHLTALIERVLSPASGPLEGKGTRTNSAGRMKPRLRPNGYLTGREGRTWSKTWQD
jgi:hypothetical protein